MKNREFKYKTKKFIDMRLDFKNTFPIDDNTSIAKKLKGTFINNDKKSYKNSLTEILSEKYF